MRIPKPSMLHLAVLALVCGLIPVAHGALPPATYTTSATRGMWVRYDGVRDWFQFGLRYVEPWWSATDGSKTGVQCADLPAVVWDKLSTISVTLYPSTGAEDPPLDMDYRVIKLAVSQVQVDEYGRAFVEAWPIQLAGPRTKKNIASARDWAFSDDFCGPNAHAGNTTLARRSLVAGSACTKDYVTILNTTGSVSIVVQGPRDFSQCDANRTVADIICANYPRPGTLAALDLLPGAMDGRRLQDVPKVGQAFLAPLIAPLLSQLLSTGFKSVLKSAAKKFLLGPIIDAIFPPSKPDPLETWNAVKGYVQEYVTQIVDEAAFTEFNYQIQGVQEVAKQFASLPVWTEQKRGHYTALLSHYQVMSPKILDLTNKHPEQMLAYIVPFGSMYIEAMALLVVDYPTIYEKQDPNADANLRNLQGAITSYKTVVDKGYDLLMQQRASAMWADLYKSPKKSQRCSPSGGCGTYSWKDTYTDSYLSIEYNNWDKSYLLREREESVARLLRSWSKLYKQRVQTNYKVNLVALTAASNLWPAQDPTRKYNIDSMETLSGDPVSSWAWDEASLQRVQNPQFTTTDKYLQPNASTDDIYINFHVGSANVPDEPRVGILGIDLNINSRSGNIRLLQIGNINQGSVKTIRISSRQNLRIVKVEGVAGEADMGVVYLRITTNTGEVTEIGDSSYWEKPSIINYGGEHVYMTTNGNTHTYPNRWYIARFSYSFSAEAEQSVQLCQIAAVNNAKSFYLNLAFTFCHPNPKLHDCTGNNCDTGRG